MAEEARTLPEAAGLSPQFAPHALPLTPGVPRPLASLPAVSSFPPRRWKYSLGFLLIPGGLLTIASPFMVDSPSSLLARGKKDEALKALRHALLQPWLRCCRRRHLAPPPSLPPPPPGSAWWCCCCCLWWVRVRAFELSQLHSTCPRPSHLHTHGPATPARSPLFCLQAATGTGGCGAGAGGAQPL